jgi:hypothetical protein
LRGDRPGADGERDVLAAGGAGELPGEVAGAGAQRPPARLLRQAGQRAARQARRARRQVAGAASCPRARAGRAA